MGGAFGFGKGDGPSFFAQLAAKTMGVDLSDITSIRGRGMFGGLGTAVGRMAAIPALSAGIVAPAMATPQLVRPTGSVGAKVEVHIQGHRFEISSQSFDPQTADEVVRTMVIPRLNSAARRQTDDFIDAISKALTP